MSSPNAEMMTATEIGRRVSLTRQRIMQLAETDPNWPIPRSEWKRLGKYWQIPWDERLEKYFAARDRLPGPKGWSP
ncbi:hypothetical protein ACH4VR_36280 [Streptomyces sp. NPDC020883]|uniref:hypothetical protein n=1 Tax=Streptomyces sp. NPDC020883 TaxID=3365099 RepID=UPI0037AC55A2